MGSILGPFLSIEPKESALDDSSRDILDYAYKQIANDVRIKARARLGTGVDLNAAVRASNIKAEYEAGRIVIRAGEESEEGEETKIGDLFQSNMEPPAVDKNKIVFREIKAKEIERKNEDTVINIVKESMALRFPEHFAEGVKRVQSVRPESIK